MEGVTGREQDRVLGAGGGRVWVQAGVYMLRMRMGVTIHQVPHAE